METHITSTPVTEIPPVTFPEEKTSQPDALLLEVSRALVADSRIKPEEYLEEVLVTMGGE